MDDAWRTAKSVGRIRNSTLNGDTDPTAVFDTCKGCGRCMHLDTSGMCNTDECTEELYQRAKTAGITRTFGDTTYYNRSKVAHCKTPPPTERTLKTLRHRGLLTDPLPTCALCLSVPRPDDSLCVQHRLEANLKAYRNRPRVYQSRASDTELPSRRLKRFNKVTHKIKGLEGIKLK